MSVDDLKEELTRSHQRIVTYDDDEEDIDLMDGEEEWGSMAAQSAEIGSEDATESSAEKPGEPSLEDLAGNPVGS